MVNKTIKNHTSSWTSFALRLYGDIKYQGNNKELYLSCLSSFTNKLIIIKTAQATNP